MVIRDDGGVQNLGETLVPLVGAEKVGEEDVAKKSSRFRRGSSSSSSKYPSSSLHNLTPPGEGDEGSEGNAPVGGTLHVHAEVRKMLGPSERPRVSLSLSVPSVNISLIDGTPREVFLLGVDWVYAGVSLSPSGINVETAVYSVQLDRFHADATFPVVFAPKAGDPEKKLPFLQLGISKAHNVQDGPVEVFRLFSVLLQEFDVKVEEAVILRLIAYAEEMKAQASTDGEEGSSAVWQTGTWKSSDIATRVYVDIRQQNEPPPGSAKKLFFRLLQLQPIAVNLSFQLAGNASSSGESSGGGPNPFKMLGTLFGAALLNLDGAPIRLNSLTIENAFGNQATLLAPIIAHYKSQGLSQAYKIIGSIEILGDPVALVGNLGEGVADFFYEPAQGLVSSPQDFASGLARGTASLLKHTITGVFGAASKVTGSIGRGVATLSMDEEYTIERNNDLKKAPRHVGEGLARGGKRLVLGVYRGVTGIFTDPYQGARRGGVGGFVRGLGVGIAGVVVKPVVGGVDFVSLTMQGIGNTATYFDTKYENKLRRASRYIPPSRGLGVYRPSLAQAQKYLFDIKLDKQVLSGLPPHEHMLGAVYANPYNHIIFSNLRVTVIVTDVTAAKKARDETNSQQFAWTQIHSIQPDKNVLTLTKADTTSQRARVATEEFDQSQGFSRRVVSFDLRSYADPQPPPDYDGKQWEGLTVDAKANQTATYIAAVLNRMKKTVADTEETARVSGVSDETTLPEVVANEAGPVFLTLAPHRT